MFYQMGSRIPNLGETMLEQFNNVEMQAINWEELAIYSLAVDDLR